MRREGKRVRLSYRYSYRQLAPFVKGDHKKAKRALTSALESIETHLKQRGLILIQEPQFSPSFQERVSI